MNQCYYVVLTIENLPTDCRGHWDSHFTIEVILSDISITVSLE